ncbi:MAG: hypothetical protein JW893_07950, partial [Candidatus Omnitrophica bacterium]|nr:hypothetical protein [Candidatus Omnitrophota bacterium]
MRKLFSLALGLTFLLAFSASGFARDWSTTDSDLPESLQGLNQDQLNMVNKINELNPASDSFSPDALALFKQLQQQPPVVNT